MADIYMMHKKYKWFVKIQNIDLKQRRGNIKLICAVDKTNSRCRLFRCILNSGIKYTKNRLNPKTKH